MIFLDIKTLRQWKCLFGLCNGRENMENLWPSEVADLRQRTQITVKKCFLFFNLQTKISDRKKNWSLWTKCDKCFDGTEIECRKQSALSTVGWFPFGS